MAAALMTPFASWAAVHTVTSASDVHVAGKMNLSEAILALNDGDTINFNIAGAGPHYLTSPEGGFPVIIKDNVTVDGYSQPGASANSNPITAANNAVIKIVIDARNGKFRDMGYTAYTLDNSSPPIDNTSIATERGGFTPAEEYAILGLYRATNANIRGLAFLSDGTHYGIAIAHDYGYDKTVHDRLTYTEGSDNGTHINGCWFGVDPANPTPSGITMSENWIAHYRHRDVSGGPRPDLPNVGLICGVAPKSANPRAEFNVFVGYGYAMDGENIRSRASGNFFGVLPDGVTPIDMSNDPSGLWTAHFEWGRYDDPDVPMIIGTDGDGVNDADEGNLFGPALNGSPVFDFYSTANKDFIIAGNTFGMGVNGVRWTNSMEIVSQFSYDQGTRLRFGSDFNGVSDDLEGNKIYNNYPFDQTIAGDPAGGPKYIRGKNHARTNAWISARGNTVVGCYPGPVSLDETFYQTFFVNYTDTNFMNSAYGMPVAIPEILTASTRTRLQGKVGKNTDAFPGIIIDVYLPDPESQANGLFFGFPELGGTTGWGFVNGKTYLGSFKDNSPEDSNPAVGEFSFDITRLGLAAGTKVTVAANFVKDTAPSVTSVTRNGGNTTIAWTGGTANFRVLKATSITGPWTTAAVATSNSVTFPDSGERAFYRVSGGSSSGQTTLCAVPVTLQ